MTNVVDDLMALQELQLNAPKSTPNRVEQMEALRSEIPESLLRIFDRFVARKRKPVAIVRNGVCSECHLQIAVGILGSLAFGQSVQQCGNCARFLYLPEDEPVCSPETSTRVKVDKPR
jgi:predicted  nucleic acid-binding Zn-ribbon protein